MEQLRPSRPPLPAMFRYGDDLTPESPEIAAILAAFLRLDGRRERARSRALQEVDRAGKVSVREGRVSGRVQRGLCLDPVVEPALGWPHGAGQRNGHDCRARAADPRRRGMHDERSEWEK